MNILFFFPQAIVPSKGGVPRVTDNLTREFIKRGHKVVFLCLASDYSDSDGELSAPQYYVDFANRDKAESRIKSILADNNINIIINNAVQKFQDEVLLLFKCAGSSVKKISCWHNTPYFFLGKERRMGLSIIPKGMFSFIHKYIRIIAPHIYRYFITKYQRKRFALIVENSDKFCLLSNMFTSRFNKYTKISSENRDKIIAINNPNTFAISNDISSDAKSNTILFLGRLESPHKLPLHFLKVWEIVHKSNPSWNAVIVGDGSDLSRMLSYVKKKNLTNINFEGHQSDVEKYLCKAKIFCLTSNHEGWPMTLTESMSYGCVPLSYDTFESVHDIIDDNVNGFITKPFSPEDMAAKVQVLIDNPDMLDNFSKAAKIKIDNFSVEKIVEKWESLFNSLSDAK